MTEPILQYVRDRMYAQGRVPEGQLALFDIVTELARRIDALEAVQPAMPELEQRARNEWLDERLNHLESHVAAVLDRLQIPGHRSVVGRVFVPPPVDDKPAATAAQSAPDDDGQLASEPLPDAKYYCIPANTSNEAMQNFAKGAYLHISPTPAPKVLYEGEADVLRDGLLLLTPGAMTILSVQKRVHIVVTAAEGDES